MILNNVVPFFNRDDVVGVGGDRRRNYLDENDKLCSVTSKEEGCNGDEKINCTDIWFEGGLLHLKEIDDIESFNVRKISENHEKYDENISKTGQMMGDFFSAMEDGGAWIWLHKR